MRFVNFASIFFALQPTVALLAAKMLTSSQENWSRQMNILDTGSYLGRHLKAQACSAHGQTEGDQLKHGNFDNNRPTLSSFFPQLAPTCFYAPVGNPLSQIVGGASATLGLGLEQFQTQPADYPKSLPRRQKVLFLFFRKNGVKRWWWKACKLTRDIFTVLWQGGHLFKPLH